jgi:hypothetical protein
LQILNPQGNNLVAWDRSYYEIALEAKRFFKTKRTKSGGERVSEVKGKSIHAGQIFAEMLGAVCHPEFFDCTDVEVYTPFLTFLDDIDRRHMSYISKIPPSNCIIANSDNCIFKNYTMMASLPHPMVS